MRKKNYIFTNKKHSNRAIMSTILGGISLVSLGIVTYLSYSQGGVMHGGYGVTGVLATIYSLIGLILGILTLREKDIYRIFPVLGTILNVVALGGVSFLLYPGRTNLPFAIMGIRPPSFFTAVSSASSS
jgi:hypothetical protein